MLRRVVVDMGVRPDAWERGRTARCWTRELVCSISAGQSSTSTISTGDPSRSRNERAGQRVKSTISTIAPSPWDPYRGLVYLSHVEDPHIYIYKYISLRDI